MKGVGVQITVKKVTTFRGRDGIGADCDVYINDVYCGTAHDDGNGGGDF